MAVAAVVVIAVAVRPNGELTLHVARLAGHLAFGLASYAVLSRTSQGEGLRLLVDMAVVFVGVNVGLALLGVEAPGRAFIPGVSRQDSGLFGLGTRRTFPIDVGSPTHFGTVAATGLIVMIGSMRARTKVREWSRITASGITLASGLVLSGTRGALLGFVVGGVALALRHRGVVIAYAMTAAVALAPWSWPVIGPRVDPFLRAASMGLLDRSGTPFNWTLTGRTTMWEIASDHIEASTLLIGHGTSGHIANGMSEAYGLAVTGTPRLPPEGMTVHNSMLQWLVEAGVLGAGIFVGVAVVVARRLRGDVAAIAGWACLLATSIVEVTLVFPSVTTPATLTATFFVIIAFGAPALPADEPMKGTVGAARGAAPVE